MAGPAPRKGAQKKRADKAHWPGALAAHINTLNQLLSQPLNHLQNSNIQPKRTQENHHAPRTHLASRGKIK